MANAEKERQNVSRNEVEIMLLTNITKKYSQALDKLGL